MPPLTASHSTGLAITNPLVLYRALLATRRIESDPAQHRLALELQKIYHRLKDYTPRTEYGEKLKRLSPPITERAQDENDRSLAASRHPLRRNPLFSHLFPRERDTLALTRVLTNHESAMNLDSPKGFMLHGDVGTGKSFLLDLLADSLPNSKKRRWHFNTFMLETMARLEQLRQSRAGPTGGNPEYSLLVLARELIEKSPILFLDEFQLPDRAASKILSNLLTSFFQLGGVLIASSNRMPDELAKASGMDFSAPARGGLVRNWLGLKAKSSPNLFPSGNEYAGFVEVLKARCDIYEMLGGRDWRRREVEEIDAETQASAEKLREEIVEGFSGLQGLEIGNLGLGHEQSVHQDGPKKDGAKATIPKNYFLASSGEEVWSDSIRSLFPVPVPDSIPWTSTNLVVYGRTVPVLQHLDGITAWTFEDLCCGTYGPADYITLASKFHTLVLDGVPILTLAQRNEARRFITLLDALYEARCKLVIRAAAGPDDLFFPEIKAAAVKSSDSNGSGDENDGGDAVYPETLSEVFQDQTSPFRPNVSVYKDETKTGYDPDEDSDFGPLPGKGNEIGRQVDFGMTGSFTGEDEKFAYKRAGSRLWEMCGKSWHARSEPGWWRPLPTDVRRWERSPAILEDESIELAESDVKIGDSFELDRPAGLQGKELEEKEFIAKSPFRVEREPPTKIGPAHAWGMANWGKKAGAWGQGPDKSRQNDGKS